MDVDTLSKTAGDAGKTVGDAATVASPTVNKLIEFLTTSEPATLGKAALALVALYYLAPFALQYLSSSVRGYAGPPPALAWPLCFPPVGACAHHVRA